MDNTLKKKSSAPALEKGLMILECLSEQAQPLTLSQIAIHVNKTVTEIQRMVTVLQEARYLTRNAQGGYSLSSKLYQMALRYPPYRDLGLILRPTMYDFVDQTHESVHLSILQDRKLTVIAQVKSPKIAAISLRLGQQQDPVKTVSGRILLAQLPKEELQVILKSGNYSKAELKFLKLRLEEIRTHHYEQMESSHYSGLFDLGIPITNSDGMAVGALTTSWLATKDLKTARDREKVTQTLLGALRGALAKNPI